MSRFYKTDKGEFADFMYKPNYEMMNKVIGQKNLEVDQFRNNINLIGETGAGVQTMNIESDKNYADAKKKEYEAKVKDLNQKVIDNALNPAKYEAEIDAFKDEVSSEIQTGGLGMANARLVSFQNMLEENKKLAETDPTTYNQMLSYYHQQVTEGAEGDINYVFNPEKFVGRPDLFQKKYQDMLAKMKAHKSTTQAGMYMYEGEHVTEDRLRSIALNMLTSDPAYQGYVRQQIMIGENQGLVGEDGNMIAPTQIKNMVTGEIISYEELQKKTAKEQANYQQVVNDEYRFASDISTIEGVYSQHGTTVKVDTAKVALAKMRQSMAIASMKEKGLNDRLAANLAYKKEAAALKALTDYNISIGKDPRENIGLQNEAYVMSQITQDIPGTGDSAKTDDNTLAEAGAKGTMKKVTDKKTGKVTYKISGNDPDAELALERRRVAREEYINSIPKGQKITIKGTGGKTIQVDAREFYDVYGDRPLNTASYNEVAKGFAKRGGLSTKVKKISTPSYNSSMGGGSVTYTTTFADQNSTVVENHLALAQKSSDSHYENNVGLGKEYKFNSMNIETSTNAMDQAKATPEKFDVWKAVDDGKGGKTWKKVDMAEDKLALFHANDQPLQSAPNNMHSRVAFTGNDGNFMMIPNGTGDFIESMMEMAQIGTDSNSSVNVNARSRFADDIGYQFLNHSTGEIEVSRRKDDTPVMGRMIPIVIPKTGGRQGRVIETTLDSGKTVYMLQNFHSDGLLINDMFEDLEDLVKAFDTIE